MHLFTQFQNSFLVLTNPDVSGKKQAVLVRAADNGTFGDDVSEETQDHTVLSATMLF